MPWRLQLEANLWLFQQETPLQQRKGCKVWFSRAHTTLQPRGEHRLHAAITRRSRFGLLVLIPFVQKRFRWHRKEEKKKNPKTLTFGCLPLDVQPKRGTAAVPRWHLTTTEPRHTAKPNDDGRWLTGVPRRSHPTALSSAGVRQRMAPVVS